jgi:TolB-like protein
VLYQAATGLAPFAATDRSELANQILLSSPPPPRTFNPRLSFEIARIMTKCLEREPDNRYQSAKELVIDLRRLQSDAPSGVQLPTMGTARRFAKGVGLSALVVGFAVALLLTFNIGNWRGRIVGKTKVPHIESLAVLPLVNLSGDPQQEYFADGMTEELINNLGKIAAVRVISRTSVMQYKQSKRPLPTIATELDVDAVIEGSVLLSKNRVRITAQLIAAKSDRHLWGNSYERSASDVLALQAEVAQEIAQQIQARLTSQEYRLIASVRPINPAAQEAYLLGRYHWNKTTEGEWKQARQYFEKATAIDPTHAPPYAGLPDYYAVDYELPTQNAFEKAKSFGPGDSFIVEKPADSSRR